MSDAVQRFDVVRVGVHASTAATDQIAREAALEVRLDGQPFSVIMRTPGSDQDLAAGFLFTEGVIARADDVTRMEGTGDSDVVNITLAPARAAALPEILGTRRQVTMNSSCGMCGRRTLESLEVTAPPLEARWTVSAATIGSLPARLRDAQPVFGETGGLHAAGLFTRDGQLQSSAEDVGRHNAVDKIIGRMLLTDRLPLTEALLFVSGRSSFEIVQKAFLSGISLVAAVSAPSSLAIDLARETGITLLGFVRDGRFNIYAHEARVSLD